MNRATFFNAIRPNFGGKLSAGQVSGIEVLLTAIDGLPISHRAYILATAFHETTQTMQPVREALAKTDAEAVRRLDAAYKKGQLTGVSKPYWRPDKDGLAWFGRGFVQLTHKVNYDRLGKRLGINLVADPSAAMNPFVAAKIMVVGMVEGLFTGKKMSDFLPGDYVGARAVVNGRDCAMAIAGYARIFEAALTTADAVAPVLPDVPPPASVPAKNDVAWFWRVAMGFFNLFTQKWRH